VSSTNDRPMKFAYADPPYLGLAEKFYGDPTYDDPKAHVALVARLCDEFSDGWAMSLSSVTLRTILPMCPEKARVAAWVKPFASFKPGVNPAYVWEPVIFFGGRGKRPRNIDTIRDYHSENAAMKRGFQGCKPPGFAQWIVQLLGADVRRGDTITDLFHGSGAMLGVWRMNVSGVSA
jgi:hypothetical protein